MKTLPMFPILALLVGCAGGWPMRTSRGVSSTPAAVTATEQQLAQELAILKSPTTARQSYDCERALDTHDNICTLARRICLLVDRDRTTPDGRARCLKARGHCQGTEFRVARKCGKPSTASAVATARADNRPKATPRRTPTTVPRRARDKYSCRRPGSGPAIAGREPASGGLPAQTSGP
jgi:hypothetical protein